MKVYRKAPFNDEKQQLTLTKICNELKIKELFETIPLPFPLEPDPLGKEPADLDDYEDEDG